MIRSTQRIQIKQSGEKCTPVEQKYGNYILEIQLNQPQTDMETIYLKYS